MSKADSNQSPSKTFSKKVLILPWVMIALGALFYFYEYLLRVSPSIMTTDLMLAYHVTAGALGSLSAFYYFIYSPMQIPVGVLMDRYGPRRLLTMAALACAIGTYFFASSTSLALAEFGRFLVGFGSAFAYVGVLKLATIWLPPQYFGMVSGMCLALGMLGGMFGDIALNEMVQVDGWRLTSYIAACLGVILTLLLFVILRDGARRTGKHTKQGEVTHRVRTMKVALVGLLKISKDPQIWLTGLVGCLLYIPTSAFAELWGPSYLKVAFNFSNTEAATANSMIFLGWAIGGPLVGMLSDRLKQRRLPITVGAIVAAILMSIVMFVPNIPKHDVFTLLLLFGVFSSAQVLTFAIAREISSQKAAATAIAFNNMIIMLSGLVFQPLIGHMLDWGWSGKIVHGVHVYTAGDYQRALLVLPVGLVITVFLTFFMRETNCRLKPQ